MINPAWPQHHATDACSQCSQHHATGHDQPCMPPVLTAPCNRSWSTMHAPSAHSTMQQVTINHACPQCSQHHATDHDQPCMPPVLTAPCNRSWSTMHAPSAHQRSGAVWKSRWPSWAPITNKPMVSVDVKKHSTPALTAPCNRSRSTMHAPSTHSTMQQIMINHACPQHHATDHDRPCMPPVLTAPCNRSWSTMHAPSAHSTMQQIMIDHACPQHHATDHGGLRTILQHRTVSSERMIQEWSTHLKHLKPVDVQNSHHFGSLVPSHLWRKPENCSLAYKPWCSGGGGGGGGVGGGGGGAYCIRLLFVFLWRNLDPQKLCPKFKS